MLVSSQFPIWISEHAVWIFLSAVIYLVLIERYKRSVLEKNGHLRDERLIRKEVSQKFLLGLSYSSFTLIVINFLLVCATVASFYNTSISTQLAYRPYVGLGKVDFVQEKNEKTMKIYLLNTGTMPANNVKIEAFRFNESGQHDNIEFPLNNRSILMPGPNPTLYIPIKFYDNDDLWGLDFSIQYNGITTATYSTNWFLYFHKDLSPYDTISGTAN